jgi:uncharacterized protein
LKPIFADSFYFIALFNAGDQAHSKAVRFAPTSNPPLLTTAWILTEVADACASFPNRIQVVDFINRLIKIPRVKVVPFSMELFDRGLELYRSRPDKEWSLTDCISFVVMKDEGVADALTGDKHFEQAGFNALLK